MKKLELFLPDADSTRAFGARLAQHVTHQAIVILQGELGAGKTTLVQGIGQALGVVELINSPTFTMLNEYHSGRLPLYHLDLYRIANEDSNSAALEFLQMELEECLNGPGIVVIEWADPIESFLPTDRLKVMLSYAENDKRYEVEKSLKAYAQPTEEGRLVTVQAYGVAAESLVKALL